MPSALRYAALLRELGPDVTSITKDLELYEGARMPPPGYSVDMEVDAISRTADAARWDRFHLYGHSGGGAVALAYVAAHPERVRSLAVDEPAYDFLDAEANYSSLQGLPCRHLPQVLRRPGWQRARRVCRRWRPH